jgi:hypothetical protein
MTNLLPLTTVDTTVFTKLNLNTTRARLLALFVLVGLLTAVGMSASSPASLRHLLFANRGEAASTPWDAFRFVRATETQCTSRADTD